MNGNAKESNSNTSDVSLWRDVLSQHSLMEELRMWWRRRRRWKSLATVVSVLLLFALLGAADASKDRHPLVFTRTRYNASIYENNIGKSYVTAESERMGIQLSSATATPQPDIRYRIVAGDKNKLFRAESRLVGDFSFLLLRTRTGQVTYKQSILNEF